MPLAALDSDALPNCRGRVQCERHRLRIRVPSKVGNSVHPRNPGTRFLTQLSSPLAYALSSFPGWGTKYQASGCARAMNRNRNLYWKPNVLLESGQAEAGILDVLRQRVMADGE